MAQRRMFSLKIINSARFLKMPISSQLLYFHLGLNADDDGVVEGYNVIRMTNCTEDDLKILVAKELVIVLNADLVSFITDWQEHNLIRPDRKINSIYKDLLLQMVTEVKLLESKPRSNLKAKKTINNSGQPLDDHWTTNGPHRLGKVRLVKGRLGKVKLGKFRLFLRKKIPTKVGVSSKLQPVIDKWNSLNLSKIINIKGTRLKLVKARIKEYSIEDVLKAIEIIKISNFLKGQNKTSWVITFDWFIKPNNFIKVLEGNYKDNKGVMVNNGTNIGNSTLYTKSKF
ncbi:hypothetical protein [Clostridium sp. FP1]|uniref:hypothetical protein n=1 Tax=Clostridium sp. FP1 TaxID=2724076 RepID=UPI001CCEF0B9|nr:hypothetical protein [Clostridium sp. FP1]MBZ9635619.1 hypothetical protein [Clostridium sp. FP1]